MTVQTVLTANGAAGVAAAQAAVVSLTTPMGGGPLSLYVVFDVTVFAGTSLTLLLEGYDSASGKTWALGAALTAVAATGTKVYVVSIPAATVAGGITAAYGAPVPPAVKISISQVAITQASYTVSAHWN